MKLSRTLRSFAAVLAFLGVVVAQFGLASYACPMAAAGEVEMVEHSMPDCGGMVMDALDPALCHAHCQQGDQSADNPRVPPFVAVMDLGALAIRAVPLRAPPAHPPEEPLSLLSRPTAPALAVRNCCFRT